MRVFDIMNMAAEDYRKQEQANIDWFRHCATFAFPCGTRIVENKEVFFIQRDWCSDVEIARMESIQRDGSTYVDAVRVTKEHFNYLSENFRDFIRFAVPKYNPFVREYECKIENFCKFMEAVNKRNSIRMEQNTETKKNSLGFSVGHGKRVLGTKVYEEDSRMEFKK